MTKATALERTILEPAARLIALWQDPMLDAYLAAREIAADSATPDGVGALPVWWPK